MSAVKLKASCDRCALDKVKCGKQHPCCIRCKQTRRTCVYGVSQRSGKSLRAKQLLRPQLSSTDLPPATIVPSIGTGSPHTSQTPNPGTPDTAWDFWTPSDMAQSDLPWHEGFNTMDMVVANGLPAYDAMSTTATWPLLTESSSTLHGSRSWSQPITPSMHDPMTPKPSEYSPAATDMNRPCCDPSQLSEQLCEILALGKTNSMTLDSLLHKLATVSLTTNTSLRCTCAKDYSLLMMLAASAFEILALYRAIANVKNSSPQPNWRASKQLSLRDSDLALGNFKLDEKTSSAVRDQLVLSQLHEMREKWEEYVDSLSRDKTKAVDGIRVHFAITDVMLAQLNSTMEEIESRRKDLSRRS